MRVFPSRASAVRAVLAGSCLLTVCVTRLAHSQSMAGHDMGAMKATAAPADLPAPTKMSGLGNSHLAITATPEAQAWFDQGLNQFHDFWEYESMKSFEQAIRVDPKCAMCYWGLTNALGFRSGWNAYMAASMQSAMDLRKTVTPKERLYIEALDASVLHNDKKAQKLYRQIVDLDPADLQAKIFLAESLMDGFDDKHEPKAGTREGTAILEAALKQAPDDSALNHYWIHAMEPGNHPERAIGSAEKLASLSPASGHMVHMPGHIFYRTGQYDHAEKWFADSSAVDEAYLQSSHVDIDDDWNYVHNLMYRIANLMEEGKFAEASAVSARLSAAHGHLSATLYPWSANDSVTRLNVQLPVAMREGDWSAILTMLSAAKPDAKLVNLNFLAGNLRDYATGMAAIQAGDLPAAEAASTKLGAETADQASKLPPDDKSKHKVNKHPQGPVQEPLDPDAQLPAVVKNGKILSAELRAQLALAHKDPATAKTLFAEAATGEQKLGYHEPPALIQPVHEAEGAALLKSGDPAGAHAAFAAELTERPNSGFALYGEAEASAAAGNAANALTEYARFLAAWKDADPQLPQKQKAQAFVDTHPVTASLGH